jgi:hypothetical protein
MEDLLAPRPSPKLQDYPLSAVRDCLFNIFAATLHIGYRSFVRTLRTRHAVVTGTTYHGQIWLKCEGKNPNALLGDLSAFMFVIAIRNWIEMKYYSQTQHISICHAMTNVSTNCHRVATQLQLNISYQSLLYIK